MKFSLNWIKEYVDIDMEPEKVGELLSLKSFEVEEVVKKGDDYILNIDILPNRPDCLSHYGLAREIAALTDSELKSMEIGSVIEDKTERADEMVKLTVKNKDLVPRYSAILMKNVEVGPTPKKIKERLESLGLQSINNVVDITNYVMLETGQPLHAFDYERIKDGKLYARLAHKGESLVTLDDAGTKYELDDSMVVISDIAGPLAIGGVKGGKNSGVEDSTHTILIESANFDKSNIKLTSRRLGLITDASTRFSYGVDPNLTLAALERVAGLISEHAMGVKISGVVDTYPKKLKDKTVFVSHEYINSLIGLELEKDDVIDVLGRLGLEARFRKNGFAVNVPTFRLDIETEEDIVEEIARVYGYDRIEAKAPVLPIFGKTPKALTTLVDHGLGDLWDTIEFIRIHDLIKTCMATVGLNEAYTYSFISDEAREMLNLENVVELENPMSHRVRYMRPFLNIGLVGKVLENLRFTSDVKLFESGRIFKKDKDELVKEFRRVGGVMTGDFFIMKGLLDSFFNRLGIADIYYDDSPPHKWDAEEIRFYHPGSFALVKSGNDILGVVGEINPLITREMKLKQSIVGFELDLEELAVKVAEEREYEPISKYPSIIRDISILLPKEVRISHVLNLIKGADNDGYVRDVDLFDIYEDLSDDRKSLAFHVIYGSDKKTLKDSDIDGVEKNIKKALEEGAGAEIR